MHATLDPQKEIDRNQKASYLPDIHRMLPQAQDAEKGILCSFLLAPRQVGDLCQENGVTSAHFHTHQHGIVFSILDEFYRDNEPLDFVTIAQTLQDRGQLEAVGGKSEITELFTFLPTAANAKFYAETLREKYALRQIISVCTEYGARSYDQQDQVWDLIDGLSDKVMNLMRMKEGQRIHSREMDELVKRAMDRIDVRLSGGWTVDMPTGIRALDKACLGFKPATVTLITGKPSDGKSSLGMNIAEHLAMSCGKRVGIISLDDTDDEVTDRLIQQRARVSLFDIEVNGVLSASDHSKLTQAAIELGKAKDRIFIRDDGALKMSEIAATFAAWQARFGLDFGIIDHIQLAKGDGFTRGSTEEASQVSRALKPMAKRFGIPLLVLSQVTESSTGGIRTKNTTSFQEDANRIWSISHPADGTHSWIDIGKQKNGPKSLVPVKYLREFTRFTDLDENPSPDQPELVHMAPGKKNGKRS